MGKSLETLLYSYSFSLWNGWGTRTLVNSNFDYKAELNSVEISLIVIAVIVVVFMLGLF